MDNRQHPEEYEMEPWYTLSRHSAYRAIVGVILGIAFAIVAIIALVAS